jgi:hypothetical protein
LSYRTMTVGYRHGSGFDCAPHACTILRQA